MAFHPFKSFRKHQKGFLAGLTILAMLTFIGTGVMSQGKGDAFGFIAELFGGRGSNPNIIKLYGKKIGAQDIEQLRAQRVMANRFMATAVSVSANKISSELEKSADRVGDAKNQVLGLTGQLRSISNMYMQFGRGNQEFLRPFLSSQMNEFRNSGFRVSNLLTSTGKKEEAKLVDEFLASANFEFVVMQRGWDPDIRDTLYFGGSVGLNDLLDFIVMRRQADRLGIQLTEENVKEELAAETLGRADNEMIEQLLKGLSQKRRVTQKEVFAALADEFRVRKAQSALLGYEGGLHGMRIGGPDVNRMPAPITPEDFWKYYDENCVPVKVGLLPLPVKDFVSKDEQPPEKELNELFTKYKEKEPTPDSDKPGFKQPRRIMVEWVSARPDSEFYQKSSKLGSTILQGLEPGFYDLLIKNEYQKLTFGSGTILSESAYPQTPLIERNFVMPFYAVRAHPEQAAAVVSGLAAVQLGGNPLGVLARYNEIAIGKHATEQKPHVAAEAKIRAGVGSTLLLHGATLSPFGSAGVVWHLGESKRDLPLDAVKSHILERMRQDLARQQVASNLDAFSKELKNKRSDPKEAAEYIAKAIKDFGLTVHGRTDKSRDRFDIADDKGMAELRTASTGRADPKADPKGERFASTFFKTTGAFDPQEDFRFTVEGHSYVFWRTEDKPAYVPKFDDVKAHVVEAWRLIQARPRAKKAAEELKAKAQDAKIEAIKVLDEVAFKNPERGRVITLENVARLQPRDATMEMATQYQPYKIPEDQIAYPREDLLKQLTALRQPGEGIVVSDRPEKIYYVASLLKRAEPSPEDFHRIYAKTPFRDKLLEGLERERRKQYREAVYKELRAEAGTVDKYDRFVIDIDEDLRRSVDNPRYGTQE